MGRARQCRQLCRWGRGRDTTTNRIDCTIDSLCALLLYALAGCQHLALQRFRCWDVFFANLHATLVHYCDGAVAECVGRFERESVSLWHTAGCQLREQRSRNLVRRYVALRSTLQVFEFCQKSTVGIYALIGSAVGTVSCRDCSIECFKVDRLAGRPTHGVV